MQEERARLGAFEIRAVTIGTVFFEQILAGRGVRHQARVGLGGLRCLSQDRRANGGCGKEDSNSTDKSSGQA